MICPKCGSDHVKVTVINEVREKRKRGFFYWFFIGFWLEPILWVVFTIPKLLFSIFGKKTKVVGVNVKYAICQECGYKWKLK